MKTLLRFSLPLLLAAAALLYPAAPKAHTGSPPRRAPVYEPARQDAEQEPPDAFDEDSPQPASVDNPKRDFSRSAYTSSAALNRAVLDIIQTRAVLEVREDPLGSDSGPEVNTYLAYCGVQPHHWWCAAFVSYQIHQASLKPNVPRSRWPKYALCDDIGAWARRNGLIIRQRPGANEQPCDEYPCVMLIRKFGDPNKKYKHIGFVIGYDPATGKVETIEGNSNENHSTQGIGVFRLHRTKTSSMVFVRIV